MSRFRDLYLWSEAIKVISFIVGSFFLILVERLTRLLLTLVGCFVPNFVAAWAARKWQGTVLPVLPQLLRRSPSFSSPSSSPAGSPSARRGRLALDESLAELYYDAPDLIRKRGYPFEQHYVETSDGFLLGLHRIPHGKDEGWEEDEEEEGKGSVRSPRPVVFLQHGFLQSSEAFVAARRNLPFALADAGFDVWLGNARGNKYSAHHRHLRPDSDQYWNFCIDDVAALDLPASIPYVLRHTRQRSLAYVGFSMGTAVAFAAFSTNSHLSRMVHSFIALAPATTARGFSQPMLDSVAKMSPDFVYFLLGRRALFGSLFFFWQNLLSSPQFVRVIDFFVRHMFSWQMARVDPADKPVLYSHIYSMSSVKSVVHWFQIMKHQSFHMYLPWSSGKPVVFAPMEEGAADGSPSPSSSPAESPSASPAASPSASPRSSPRLPRPPLPPRHHSRAPLSRLYRARVAPVYPLDQIDTRRTSVHVLWGSGDALPDTEWLLANLPRGATSERFEGYEHLDFLYAAEAKEKVFPGIVERCRRGAEEVRKREEREATHREGKQRQRRHGGRAGGGDEGEGAEALFAQAVLRRDEHCCVRCGASRASEGIHAVHILPPCNSASSSSADSSTAASTNPATAAAAASLHRAHLLHGYECSNGLTLCGSCTPSFERGEWGLQLLEPKGQTGEGEGGGEGTDVALPQQGRTVVRYFADDAAAPLLQPVAAQELTRPTEQPWVSHWPTRAVMAEHAALCAQKQRRQQQQAHASSQLLHPRASVPAPFTLCNGLDDDDAAAPASYASVTAAAPAPAPDLDSDLSVFAKAGDSNGVGVVSHGQGQQKQQQQNGSSKKSKKAQGQGR